MPNQKIWRWWNIAKTESPLGRYMKGKRQSTVEPVFGTLIEFMGMRQINTIGIKQANKVMHLSAIAYSLKKHLKFDRKRSKSGAVALALAALAKSMLNHLFGFSVGHRKLALDIRTDIKKPLKGAYIKLSF